MLSFKNTAVHIPEVMGEMPPQIPPQVPPIDSDSAAISLAFLISLSVTFAILMIILIMVAAYVTFCGADEAEFDEESGQNAGNGSRLSGRPFSLLFNKKHSGILLDSSFTSPGAFDDTEELREREQQEFSKMSNFEIELYKRAKEFQKMSPPNVSEFGSYLNSNDQTYIKDRGIQSYFFLPSINDNTDRQGHFLPSFIIQDKLDVAFTKFNTSSSTVMNYPLPYNKKDAVYFEVKVYRHNPLSNSIFSIGLSTVPYPYFRIPGMSNFSIAYESTGKLRINNPFSASTLLPKLQEGDIVGFGYKYRTGTIFITHNGKKLMDVTQNVNIDLFVSIGAFNAAYTRNYTIEGLKEDPDNIDLQTALAEGREPHISTELMKIHNPHDSSDFIESDDIELNVNLGQIGYVFIEANVKKYSFGSIFGEIGIPPAYNGSELNKDTVLQKGEELPPNYSDFVEDGEELGSSTVAATTTSRPTPGISTYERISSVFDRENNVYDSDMSPIPQLGTSEEPVLNEHDNNEDSTAVTSTPNSHNLKRSNAKNKKKKKKKSKKSGRR